jgi:outer membrane protein OmpA-like peptidoglycan-associated protein
MKTHLALTMVLTGAMLAGGCATKKYVRNTAAPIQAKVDQVGEQANRNTAGIEETRKEVKSVDERAEAGISAVRERAMTADNKAVEAMNKATEAGTVAADARDQAQKANTELASLRTLVSNIDDYKLANEATVNFAFGRDALTDESKQALDQLVANHSNMKRYVIAVEGFTDSVGSAEYNRALSQRRANNVVHYLVTQHNVPLYRVYVVGLGEDRPADEGRNREARAKNRRVEVKIFSADQTMASSSPAAGVTR